MLFSQLSSKVLMLCTFIKKILGALLYEKNDDQARIFSLSYAKLKTFFFSSSVFFLLKCL